MARPWINLMRWVMERKGMTQIELGEAIGWSKNKAKVISKYLKYSKEDNLKKGTTIRGLHPDFVDALLGLSIESDLPTKVAWMAHQAGYEQDHIHALETIMRAFAQTKTKGYSAHDQTVDSSDGGASIIQEAAPMPTQAGALPGRQSAQSSAVPAAGQSGPASRRAPGSGASRRRAPAQVQPEESAHPAPAARPAEEPDRSAPQPIPAEPGLAASDQTDPADVFRSSGPKAQVRARIQSAKRGKPPAGAEPRRAPRRSDRP